LPGFAGFGVSPNYIACTELAHLRLRLLAEIGADMSVFPTAKHLCSWSGCCPRNDQSGGKVKSNRISRAGSYMKPLLVQLANAVIRSKVHPEFGDRYRRIKARRGHKKAIIAACRMFLTAIWNILSKLQPYSADGFHSERTPGQSKVITKAQGLELLRLRGYILKDDPICTHPKWFFTIINIRTS
jgi:transposase